MATYSSPHDSSFFTRRAITMAVAIAVQVGIVVVFSSGLATRVINIVAPPIQTDIVQEVQKRNEPPPPPPPKMERPPVEVPPPDIAINVPVETNNTAITNVTTKPQPKAPPPPPPAPVHHTMTGVGVSGRNFPNSSDFYPPASQRLGEEGTALVHACVGPNGRLVQPPTLAKTSGHSRLDEAAIRLATAASGKYKPATEDGKPISACTTFGVKFQLQ